MMHTTLNPVHRRRRLKSRLLYEERVHRASGFVRHVPTYAARHEVLHPQRAKRAHPTESRTVMGVGGIRVTTPTPSGFVALVSVSRVSRDGLPDVVGPRWRAPKRALRLHVMPDKTTEVAISLYWGPRWQYHIR